MQVIVFDLEYGQPAASSPLPASRPPLDALLGCYGHAGGCRAPMLLEQSPQTQPQRLQCD